MDSFSIHLATPAEILEAKALRLHVFIDIQNFALDTEQDGHDESALHFVATDMRTSKVVGTIRVVKTGDEEVRIGKVVISPEHQGKGLGKRMMDHVNMHLASDNVFRQIKWSKLSGQCEKRVFYEKCGFEARGNAFDISGIPHVWMYKLIQHK